MLHLHRAVRADALVPPLAAVLAQPPADPFEPDLVAVPTRGVERWLAQRLSHALGAGPDRQDGVCANVSFASPARMVADVLASVQGLDPGADPWRADALGWAVLQVIDECASEPWCSVLGRHLGLDGATGEPGRPGEPGGERPLRAGRRLRVATHLASLYTGYGAQRPQMLLAWAAGRDEDGTGGPLEEDLAWQAELWRRLRTAIGTASPAERLGAAVQRLEQDPALAALPGRLSVFGATRLAADQLAVLGALSRHRQVHLWLVHPSPVMWQRLSGAASSWRRRAELAATAAHPLLASMARDARELQVSLTGLAVGPDELHPPVGPQPTSPTLLQQLQRRLAQDDADGAPQRIAPDDRSVQVHACHGPSRQVEVLRDVLAGLFADDPTLAPRDVIVMCPDVEAFAPLVSASFGLDPDAVPEQAQHPGQRLPVRLADRALRQTNPALSLLSALLGLADGRVSASEVLDLAAMAPVRRRFAFDEDDLDRVRQWVVDAGVRWGEDGRRRAAFGLPGLLQGTWEAALDRILLGVAMAEEDQRFVGPALPLDDVDSTDVDLAGRLAELVERLAQVLRRLSGHRPAGEWLSELEGALELLADAPPAQRWQLGQARQVLAEVRASLPAGPDARLRLPDLRALLENRLAGRPTRAGFRTGALTVCSLEPMRAVPHRVVCVLGLDDGAFPRRSELDGDNVLLRDPLVGERDRRSEDRQLFLDAVTAAGEHLVLLYSGADERTGARRPPAVPVSEVLDALDRCALTAQGEPVSEQVLVRHPLQAVDERCFAPGALHRPGPFSFDPLAHRAAVAGRGARAPRPAFLLGPLPAPARSEEIELDELVAVLEHPARFFLRQRLRLSLATDEAQVADRMPLELDPLQRWAVGDRLLAAQLTGVDAALTKAAEWRRGQVPPRELGRRTLDDVSAAVEPLVAQAVRLSTGPAELVDVRVDLPDGRLLVGSVPGVHGRRVVRTVYSKLSAKHRVRAWVQLLALTAGQDGGQDGGQDAGRPAAPWQAVTVGRPPSGTGAALARLIAPPAPVALQRLQELAGLRDRALREPLPMPVDTAFAYARSRCGGDTEEQALAAARAQWESRQAFEARDVHNATVWRPAPSRLDVLLEPPGRTEQAWWPQDGTRLGVLARRVWEALLACEELVQA